MDILLSETSNSSLLLRNLHVDNCRYRVSLTGKGEELDFPSAHNIIFKRCWISFILLGFWHREPPSCSSSCYEIGRQNNTRYDSWASVICRRLLQHLLCKLMGGEGMNSQVRFSHVGEDITCR